MGMYDQGQAYPLQAHVGGTTLAHPSQFDPRHLQQGLGFAGNFKPKNVSESCEK